MEEFRQQEKLLTNELSTEINKMAEEDQIMRKGWEQGNFIEADKDLDKKNTARMKEIVAEIGWPTISKVGEKASHDAWILIQHANHDFDFQKYCLELMLTSGEKEVDQKDLAFLEDRVRVNAGELQLYGTQFYPDPIHKIYIPRPIKDLENLAQRRQERGMEPLDEYARNWDEENEQIRKNH